MSKFIAENRELFAAIVGGLIGVFGSISTMIASHYLRLAGKVTMNLTQSDIVLARPDGHGQQESVGTFEQAIDFNISLGIDVYNSSDVPRSLRELEIEIRGKRGKVFTVLPSVLKDNYQGFVPYHTLGIMNLPPKELKHFDFKSWIKVNNLPSDMRGELTISFKAKYPNGWRFKRKLLVIDPEKPKLQVE